jgi:hypothetical protein
MLSCGSECNGREHEKARRVGPTVFGSFDKLVKF